MPFWSHNTSHKQTIGLLTDNLFYLLLICHGCQPQKVRVPSLVPLYSLLGLTYYFIVSQTQTKQTYSSMVHKERNNLSIYIECNLQSACLKIMRQKLARKLSVALKLTDMLGFCLLNNQLIYSSRFTSHNL